MTTSPSSNYFALVLAGAVGLSSCTHQPTAGPSFQKPNGTFYSPSGNLRLLHDTGNERAPAGYGIYDKEGKLLGVCPSIVTADGIRIAGLPVSQAVNWSPSERTVLIYENMSDASPEYRYFLMTRNASGNYESRSIDLGKRWNPLPYGEWPSVESIDDSRVKLRWASDPKSGYVSIPSSDTD